MSIVALVIIILGWIYFGIATVVGYFTPEALPAFLNNSIFPQILAFIAAIMSIAAIIQKEQKSTWKIIAIVALVLSVIMLIPVLFQVFIAVNIMLYSCKVWEIDKGTFYEESELCTL